MSASVRGQCRLPRLVALNVDHQFQQQPRPQAHRGPCACCPRCRWGGLPPSATPNLTVPGGGRAVGQAGAVRQVTDMSTAVCISPSRRTRRGAVQVGGGGEVGAPAPGATAGGLSDALAPCHRAPGWASAAPLPQTRPLPLRPQQGQVLGRRCTAGLLFGAGSRTGGRLPYILVHVEVKRGVCGRL